MSTEEQCIEIYRTLDFEHPEQLLHCAQNLMGPDVIVMDGNFNPLLSEQIDIVEQKRKTIMQLNPLSRITPETPIAEIHRGTDSWLCCGVFRQSIPVIFCAILRESAPFYKEDWILCDALRHALDLWLSAQSPRNMLYRKTSSIHINLFTDLLNEKISSTASLEKRMDQIGITPPHEFCILTIDMKLHQDNEVALFLAAEFVTELLRCPMFCVYENMLVFLVNTVETSPWSPVNSVQLKERLKRFSLRAGCSLSCTDLSQTASAFKDSQRTLALGFRLHPDEVLYVASDYMTYIMLDIASKQLTITQSINPALMTLKEYDENHKSNLLITLFQYLKYPKSPNVAAKNLNIHRNTYFYRMNLIRSLLEGTQLDDGEMIMRLMLSYHILFFNGLMPELPM